MRLFVAVYPSKETVDDLAAYTADLRVGRAAQEGVNARLAGPANWHVTLVFLGEVEDDRLDAVRQAVGDGVRRWATRALGARAGRARAGPGRAGAVRAGRRSAGGAVPAGERRAPLLRVAGGGRFGRGRFTVLWAGLSGDVAPLTELALAVRRALKRARLPFDEKPPRPHLTIARPGAGLSAEAILADLAALAEYHGPQWTAREVVLVRSTLGAKPSYEHVGGWSLDPAQWPQSSGS